MNPRTRFTKFVLSVPLALALTAMWAPPAFADDSVPPAEEASPEETASSEPSSELTAELPENTELVVVNEDGEPVPLASEEAADIVLESDPVWCPAGVTPGGAGCSPTYPSLKALADALMAGTFVASGDGVIWIQGYAAAGNVIDPSGATILFDGNQLPGIKSAALTLRGGWTGTGTGVNMTDPSVFDQGIVFSAWLGSITITDITISGAPTNGLDITTNGSIALTRVRVNSNTGHGARLINSGGTGAITVSTSEFIGNDTDGLRISSAGAVTLTSLYATGNGANLPLNGVGAVVDNTAGSLGVTLLGMSTFNENHDGGLHIFSDGPIKVNSITANANPNGYGAFLDNTTAAIAQPVTLTGFSEFKYNENGLVIHSLGAITTNNITTNGNSQDGTQLSNAGPYGALISMLGVNYFVDNDNTGLSITSFGAVTLNAINAISNGVGIGNGVYINNAGAPAAKTIKFTGASLITESYGHGMLILSKGLVTLNNMTVIDNGGQGVHIDNTFAPTSAPQNITLTGTNLFSGNAQEGLFVNSYGAIAAANVSAFNNGTLSTHDGVELRNDGGTLAKPVTLSGINRLEGNAGNGLNVWSKGAITVASLTSRLNGYFGAELHNYLAPSAQKVAFTGTSNLSSNTLGGLSVQTRGPVAIANFTAIGNEGGNGAYIDNTYAPTAAPQNVTFTGFNYFDANYYDGLHVASYGLITLNNITATGNGTSGSIGRGVYLNNYTGATLARNIAFPGKQFFGYNLQSGVVATSRGAISVTAATVVENGEYGLSLDNAGAGATGGITLATFATLLDNASMGVYALSRGAITMANVTASGNAADGVVADNSAAPSAQKIALTGTNRLNDNGGSGLSLTSKGVITVNSLTAVGNVNYGMVAFNNITGTPAVTLTGINLLSDNGLDGLHIVSSGAVTLNRLTADDNGGDGVDVTTNGAITIACGSFNANGAYGMVLTTPSNTITLKVVSANLNASGPQSLTYTTLKVFTTCP